MAKTLSKHHLIQQILEVVKKVIYKLGMTVQDLVNDYCSGLPASLYEIFNISYDDTPASFTKLWSSCLRRTLNCHNVTGAHLGARNRTCLLGELGCSTEQNDHLPPHACWPLGFPSVLTNCNDKKSGGLCDSCGHGTTKMSCPRGTWGEGRAWTALLNREIP